MMLRTVGAGLTAPAVEGRGLSEGLGPTRGSVCKEKVFSKLLAADVGFRLELQVTTTFARAFQITEFVFDLGAAPELDRYMLLVREDATELHP
jgi:hypothetical protein